MHRFLRLVVGLNLVLFTSLLIATGSPIPTLRYDWIRNTIDAWWVLSTVAVFVLFTLLLINGFRGKGPSPFWIDIALTIAWFCACVLIVLVGASQFAAF